MMSEQSVMHSNYERRKVFYQYVIVLFPVSSFSASLFIQAKYALTLGFATATRTATSVRCLLKATYLQT